MRPGLSAPSATTDGRDVTALDELLLAAATSDQADTGGQGLLAVLGLGSLLPLVDPAQLLAALRTAALDDAGYFGEWLAFRLDAAAATGRQEVGPVPPRLAAAARRTVADARGAVAPGPVPAALEVAAFITAGGERSERSEPR